MTYTTYLFAQLLTAMWREGELLSALLDWMQSEDSSDDEDQLEEMTIKAEILTRLCALEAKVGRARGRSNRVSEAVGGGCACGDL